MDQKVSFKIKRKIKSNIPIIRCICGAKILVVPDLVVMNRALKRHLTMYKDADEQLLIAQIFDVANKQAVHKNLSVVYAVQWSFSFGYCCD